MATPKGTTVSMSKTPQAKNDAFKTAEQGSVTLNVMANDLGGHAKSLYSVDQSNLLNALTTTTLRSGASISIIDGQIVYNPGTAFEGLAAGQTATDTFTYAIRLANGTISTATATVTINGKNDAPIAEAVTASGDEDAVAPIAITLKGSDIDEGDTVMSFKVATLPDVSEGVLYTDVAMTVAYVAGDPIPVILGTETANIYFKPAADFNGSVEVDYTANDGTADSAPATITVTVADTTDLTALTVDFEDQSGFETALPVGYKGFDWQAGSYDSYDPYNTLYTLDGDTYSEASGYEMAGTRVAFTPFGSESATITRSDDSDFIFDSVELTSAWRDWMTIRVTGTNNGTIVGTADVVVTDDASYLFDPSWGSIDELTFDVVAFSVDDEWGEDTSVNHLVLDNFEFLI